MEKRKETPDILSKLTEKQQNDSIPVKHQDGKLVKIDKVKSTFYLSQETSDELEEIWFKLRKDAASKRAISKSLIVDTALKMVIKDMKEHGKSSQLAVKLL